MCFKGVWYNFIFQKLCNDIAVCNGDNEVAVQNTQIVSNFWHDQLQYVNNWVTSLLH